MKGNNFKGITGMTSYIGAKIVDAKPMSLVRYNDFKGWTLPENEDGSSEGYIVQYEDGYVSWSPKKQFEDANRKTDGVSFGLAVEALKKGLKVQRKGWNGKGMFLFLVAGSTFKVSRAPLMGIYQEGTEINYCPHIDMRTADGSIVPWLASQTDVLADDWIVLK